MNQQFLKITYHLGSKKMNAYLNMPSPTYHVLKKEIDFCLFEERKQPRCETRTFWIDDDKDEIEIINQCDYEVFRAKRSKSQHLHVAPVDMAVEEPDAASTSNDNKKPLDAGSYDFAVHDHIECDSCLMSPIIGFRYKCIQCPDYDLCQNCESKHIHSEHMMVRMPTKNFPSVVEAYVTGRNGGRRHGKRSKASCPFVKNGLSVAIDDDAEAPISTGGDNTEESLPGNGKERHHGRKYHRRSQRNNFFSHLYEMMNDFAEGGGAAAAAHAMGESATSSKTFTSGPQQTTSTKFSSNKEDPIAAAAAATAAEMAAKQAHEAAVKTAEIAAKVAHETALKAAKNVIENISAGAFASASTAATKDGVKEKEPTKEKFDANTSPNPEPQPTSVPVIPSPSLESFVQFLDPQYMRTGIQILNNFSDMFAKMLDPMEDHQKVQNQSGSNSRKNSDAFTKSSSSANLNSGESEKKCAESEEKCAESEEKCAESEEKCAEVDQSQDNAKESQTHSTNSSQVEIDDLGSDSENESTGSFVKLYTPKNGNMTTSTASTKSGSFAQTSPPQSLDKSNTVDFAQLSADLKAHIAEEAAKDSLKTVETNTDFVDKPTAVISTATATEPVVTKTTSTSTSPNHSEEKRYVPVYHADQRINNAVHAMISMGFSNEGAYLTQLLESVGGEIHAALDIMSAAQTH